MELETGPLKPSAAVARAAGALSLVWQPSTGTGRSGERLGRSLGSSAEFSEHRSYAPGDDVRHIDWRAYARSDQLVVRRFREEIAPRLDVVLDASRSLAVHADKARAAIDLFALWDALGTQAGFATRLWLADEQPRRVDRRALAERGVTLDGTVPLSTSLAALRSLGPGGVRVIISDWMAPQGASDLFEAAFARASAGLAIAVWERGELDPPEGGALRLIDAETGAQREVEFDAARRSRFIERVARWRAELTEGARRQGVPLVEWTAATAEDGESALTESAREHLGPLGLVAAR